MKVFRVRAEVKRFQQLVLVDDEDWKKVTFQGRPITDWKPLNTRIFNPLLERGNFFNLTPSALVFDEIAYDKVGDLLEMAGQILPIWDDATPLYLLNVTVCVNALDIEASEWRIDHRTGDRLSLLNYAFFADMISESSLFKIPQTVRAEILGYSGVKNVNDEFWGRYRSSGLRGLVAEELFHT